MRKNPEVPDTPNAEEFRIVRGKKYRRVDTGYTIREFYSHSTPERGPGPGWDTRQNILEKYGVNEPAELPDQTLYHWELVDETPEDQNNAV